MPVYRELGNGDALAGMNKTHAMSYQELNEMVCDMGHYLPVSGVVCHDPDDMHLRVTRLAFMVGIQKLAAFGV
jgi:nitrite reductase (cytochrome c-552)